MKNLLLIFAILLGILIPEGAEYSFLIKYLLMGMLFFAFLKMNVKHWRFEQSHFLILLFNYLISIGVFLILREFNVTLAQVTFLIFAAPTAIAAPSIINILKGNIDYTFISMLLTNFAAAIFFPPVLSFLILESTSISVMQILLPVFIVISAPFVLAFVTRSVVKRSKEKINLPKDLSFYLLVANIFLGVSKASHFIRNEVNLNDSIIYLIPLVVLITVVINFYFGYLFGEKKLKLESAQSLGQKNNAFLIWIALTFINPLVAVGPVCYVVFQNLYISYQLYKKQKASLN